MDEAKLFPADPLLVKLLEAAKLTDDTVIYDWYGFEKSYAQLLGDIIATRDAFRRSVAASNLTPDGMLPELRPYVAALTHGGYEFIVAFFAIRALGGACFPFSPSILPEEAKHYICDANAMGIIAGSNDLPRAAKIMRIIEDTSFMILQVSTDALPVRVDSVGINYSIALDPQGPGAVICTSGTTGIPKAAILPRQCLVQHRQAALGKATLSYRPPHWRGGFASAILPVLSGHKLYSLKQREDARVVWEVLRQHRVTLLIFNPVLLRRMKEVYEEHLAVLEECVRAEYVKGMRNLGSIRCSGAFLAPSLQAFWEHLTGLPLKNAYGLTEAGATATEVDVSKASAVKFNVGTVVNDHQVEVKLSNGDHGEFLIKSEWMMKGYIKNESATKAAFDEDGYLKTGDVGHIEHGEYVFEGRASDDFIGRVPRISVEFAINALAYVAEAYVLPVPDYEERAVVGAIVRVRKDLMAASELTIGRLHEDLAGMVPAYMRPYLLRVVGEEEQLLYTDSLKPNKRAILETFFGVRDFWRPDRAAPAVMVWPMRLSIHSQPWTEGHKPWDFAAW